MSGPTPHLILSTDAEKAFDHVDWTYLSMLAWILALYSAPSAQVKVNSLFSPRFPIKNGTRQGCPLSPLLFDLVLDHLLRTVRVNTDIKRTEGGQH